MLVSFYGVEPGFPLATHLITRSLEAVFPKRIYYVSCLTDWHMLSLTKITVQLLMHMYDNTAGVQPGA